MKGEDELATLARSFNRMADSLQSQIRELADLSPEQWRTPSLCAGWSVHDVLAHMVATAKETPPRFLAGMVTSGFRISRLTEKGIALSPANAMPQGTSRTKRRAKRTPAWRARASLRLCTSSRRSSTRARSRASSGPSDTQG